MHSKVKSLCEDRKWREAIECVSRVKPGPNSGKTQALLCIGDSLLSSGIKTEERDRILVSVIEAMLRLGDVEHPKKYLLALDDDTERDRFAEVLEAALRQRQGGLSEDGS